MGQSALAQQDQTRADSSPAITVQSMARCSQSIPLDYDMVSAPELPTFDYCMVGNIGVDKSIPQGGSKNGKSSCVIS